MPNIKGFTVNGEDYKYDYNQLSNKPFGYDTTVEIIPTTEVIVEDSESSYPYEKLPYAIFPLPGEVCIVSFNNVNYECPVNVYDPYSLYLGELDENHNMIFDNFPFFIDIYCDHDDIYTEGYLNTLSGGIYSISISKKDKTRLPTNSLPHEIDVSTKYFLVTSGENLTFNEDEGTYYGHISDLYYYFDTGYKYRVTIGSYSVELYSINSMLGDSNFTKYPFYFSSGYGINLRMLSEFYNRYHPTSVLIERVIPNKINISSNISLFVDRDGYEPRYFSLVDILNHISNIAQLNMTFYENQEQYETVNSNDNS